jgi:hypothetical protein
MAQKTETTIPNPIQVQKFLGGVDYPTEKASLVKHAKDKGADEDVLHALDKIGDKTYHGPNDVSEEMGKLR